MFLDAGRDRENIRIEDDVFGRKIEASVSNLVGASTDFHFARAGIGLALLVEGHHHRGRAVAQHLARVFEKGFLAFLHRNRIDHALALQAAQAGLDHAPFGRIDHHRHARDIGFGGDQIQEFRHRRFGIDQTLVHVDVDDLRAVGDLLARDFDRFVVAVVLDQFLELRRTGDVGAFADIDEQQIRA